VDPGVRLRILDDVMSLAVHEHVDRSVAEVISESRIGW